MVDKQQLAERARFMADNATTCDWGLRSLLRQCASALEAAKQEAQNERCPGHSDGVHIKDGDGSCMGAGCGYRFPKPQQEAQGGQGPDAWLHKYKRKWGGESYEMADLADPHSPPLPRDNFEWVSAEPLFLAATPKPQAEPTCDGCGKTIAEHDKLLRCQTEPVVPNVDWLAQVIRQVDGNNSLGAGALAEQIVTAMRAAQPEAVAQGGQSDKDRADYWQGRAIIAERKLAASPPAPQPDYAAMPYYVSGPYTVGKWAGWHSVCEVGTARVVHHFKPDQPERVALTPLTDEQRLDLAKAMAQRLMGWRLPADFNPDCGISFKRENDYEHPEFGRTTYFPTGTNLFTHEQAVGMLLAILPADCGIQALEVTPEAVALWLEANGYAEMSLSIKRFYGIAA